jgi:hypothetical protein
MNLYPNLTLRHGKSQPVFWQTGPTFFVWYNGEIPHPAMRPEPGLHEGDGLACD